MLVNLLNSVGGALGLAPAAPQFAVPAALPGIQARSGAELVSRAGLPVPARSPSATQTPTQLLDRKLNVEQDMLGATQVLAFALPERKGLQWATDSAKLVEHKLPPAQKSALAAAQAFQANPTVETRNAAAAAAATAGSHGPGGLAAKAASLATVPGLPPEPGADKLLPVCVAGTVVLAASLSPPSAPKPPDVPAIPILEVPRADLPAQPLAPVLPQPGSIAAAKTAAAFKPFIDRGLALAAT